MLEFLFLIRTEFQQPLSNNDRKMSFFNPSHGNLTGIKQWSEATNSSDFSTIEIRAIWSHPVGKIALGLLRECRSLNGEISASGQVSLRKNLSGGPVLGILQEGWRCQANGGSGEEKRETTQGYELGCWWMMHIFLSFLRSGHFIIPGFPKVCFIYLYFAQSFWHSPGTILWGIKS